MTLLSDFLLLLELQKNVTEEMVLCLVGNKTDLVNSRIVTQDEALQYAQTIGATYFECSALQDHGKHFASIIIQRIFILFFAFNSTMIKVYV